MTETGAVRTLVVEHEIPAPLDTVFHAWTDPDSLKRWWGPPGVTCTHAEVDLRVGGAFRLANQMPDGQVMWISGQYQLIDRPRRLEYTWQTGSVEAAEPEQVVVRFDPHGDATKVTITHAGIGSAEAMAGHEQGWVGCLNGLVDLVSGGGGR